MGRTKKIELNAEQIAKLTDWNEKKSQLEALKDEEFALRAWLVNNTELFDGDKLEGSQTIEIANSPGWKLSADKVQNYTVTNENGEIMQALNLIGSANGLNRPDLAQSLVSWKPALSTKAYKDILPIIDTVPGLKEALAKGITIKKGAPQLELIPPKAPVAPVEEIAIIKST